jgi:histidinol dehydrogenase
MREKGVLVYPVSSRRSGGLSLGINLFPDKKQCSFDCPYCEVFPFSTNTVFSQEQMEDDLGNIVRSFLERDIKVEDICFSGNGEPTMQADFPEALERATRVRRDLAAAAKLVLITNGSGLLDKRIFSLLRDAANETPGLDIWLKLDAGTPEWYEKINRSELPFEEIIEKIKEFTLNAPLTIQTMICAVDNEGPPPGEAEAWEKLLVELAVSAKKLNKVQIYGKARPSPEDPLAAALPVEFLEERALSLRRVLDSALAQGGTAPLVEVYP